MENSKSIAERMYEIERSYTTKQPREEVMALYEAIPDKNEVSDNSRKAFMHLAAEYADPEALEYLISAGAKANVKNEYGQTALHYLAIESLKKNRALAGQPVLAERIDRCVAILLNNRVSPLLRDDGGAGGDLCYHAAMKAHNLPFIWSMLKHKVKLDMTDNREGRNLLHLLVFYPARSAQDALKYAKKEEDIAKHRRMLDNCFQLAKALMEYGIDASDKSAHNKSAVEYAVENDLDKLAILLNGEYDKSDPTLEDKIAAGGKTLHQAAYDNDGRALQALLRLGGDPNEVYTEKDDKYINKTPLGVACHRLNDECVKILLDMGADPNFKEGEKGRNAFYYFATEIRYLGSTHEKENTIGKILKRLFDAGLDPDGFTDDQGHTPINLVCSDVYCPGNYIDYVRRELLELGIGDYNIADMKGVTPLMGVAKNASKSPENDVISLLEGGADMSLRDNEGNTALIYAAMNSRPTNGVAIADLLFSFGNPMPELANNEGKTAMDYAVENKNENLVKLLLNKM